MVKYIVCENKLSLDGCEYTTYGVEARKYINGKWDIIERVSDISTNREAVEKLCEKCNTHRLSSIHLKDVAEDLICEIY